MIAKSTMNGRDWWASPFLLILLVAASALPLLWPAIPPLIDLPGHLGSYKVEVDGASSPWLAHYYDFRWAIIGNLGVDILILPLAKMVGVESAAKIIVATIPPLTVAGMLLTAHEVHGRVPATAPFALVLAYAYPFQFGFVNFTLSIAAMFVSIGVWLRLARLDRRTLRAILFVPIAVMLFIMHAMGWAMFGLTIAIVETITNRRSGLNWLHSIGKTTLALMPLATPLLLTVPWWTHPSTDDIPVPFSLTAKLYYAVAILRSDLETFDQMSARLLYVIIALGATRVGGRMDPRLGFAALALAIAYLITPGIVMGAAYSDMRIIPYAVALALLALEPDQRLDRWCHVIAIAAIAFFGARLFSDGITYQRLDRGYREQLPAVDHIARGARVFAMAVVPCQDVWQQHRMDHLGALAIVRRDAFVNGQWPMPGGRLLNVHDAPADGYALDPTQFLQPASCRKAGSYSLEQIVDHLPRGAFDYLWLIDLPADRWPHAPRLIPIWHAHSGILYRIAPGA